MVLLVLVFFVWPAKAGDISDCEGNDPGLKITACSRLIHSGALNENSLASAHNNRGVGLILMGQYALAVADFDTAIRIDPKHYKAWTNRGNAYAEMGQLDKALGAFNAAIALKPGLAGAYDRRGQVHLFRGAFKRALADLNKAISLNPDGAFAYNNRGVVHESMGRITKALADYRKALELDPALDMARTNLLSLLGKTLSAGFGSRPSPRPAEVGARPTLVPLGLVLQNSPLSR